LIKFQATNFDNFLINLNLIRLLLQK